MDSENRERLRTVLAVLGDGGTTDMARRVVEWLDGSPVEFGGGIPVDRIMGLAEVAEFVGRTKQAVCNWLARGQHNCPAPFAELKSTKLFDRDQWEVWAAGHPELIKTDEKGGVVQNG